MVNPSDDPIELTPSRYETWRTRFEDERERVIDAINTGDLGDYIERVEHVGSTAVPELPAKDIVDTDIVVADEAVTVISEVLEAGLGGTRLENTAGWHPIFRIHDGQRFNDHVFAASSHRWKVSVVTREVLCSRPELRQEYERLKRELAHEYDDLTAYSRGKTAFIDRMLRVGRDAEDLAFDFTVPIDAPTEQA